MFGSGVEIHTLPIHTWRGKAASQIRVVLHLERRKLFVAVIGSVCQRLAARRIASQALRAILHTDSASLEM
jgi:hypothetical protein